VSVPHPSRARVARRKSAAPQLRAAHAPGKPHSSVSAPSREKRAPGKPAAPARPPADERIQEMLQGVRNAGLKLTPQRIAIVRALATDPAHPTAQEIFDRLQSSMPTMSFATVYNTLDALTTAGLCASLSLSPGPARFDPNMAPHHHAVCDACGLVRDVARPVSGANITEIARTLTRLDAAPALSGFEVREVEHIYRGLCAVCAAREQRGETARPKERRAAAAWPPHK
jgi:Fe2+ or Zn2+ uptake regulation protein